MAEIRAASPALFGIGYGEAVSNGETESSEAFEGLGQVSFGPASTSPDSVAWLTERSRLPSGIVGIGLGEAVSNREAVSEALERLGQVSLRHEHVANPLVGTRTDRAAIRRCWDRLGEAVEDLAVCLRFSSAPGEIGLQWRDWLGSFRGPGSVSWASSTHAYLVADGEIALPSGIAGIGFGEAVSNREAVAGRL